MEQGIPLDALNWKVVQDHTLNTILGSDVCTVKMLDSDEYQVLFPGEDDRIRRAQIVLFCAWIVAERESISSEQLRYILHTLEMNQALLASALLITESALSQFLSGNSNWRPSRHRQVAILIHSELHNPGYIKQLAQNQVPTTAGTLAIR